MIRNKHIGIKLNEMRVIFPEMPLAHKYCIGQGIEFGAAAHNPFGLRGSINVAPADDFDFYKYHQIKMCGQYAEIDIEAEAHDVPLPDESQDYIISSHVIEHIPNPIAAFLEWNRFLKPDGIIFMIVPKRDAHPPDKLRPISTLEEIIEAYEQNYTVDTFPDPTIDRRGHYFVYKVLLVMEIIAYCNLELGFNWKTVRTEDSDSKVGNGFTVIARKES